MGKRDSLYRLFDQVELDEGFFTTETPDSGKCDPFKRGHGSQRKKAVLVMAESSVPTDMPAKKYSTCKKVGHIKMMVIPDLKAATEEGRQGKEVGRCEGGGNDRCRRFLFNTRQEWCGCRT